MRDPSNTSDSIKNAENRKSGTIYRRTKKAKTGAVHMQ